jgi:hypothetical protein
MLEIGTSGLMSGEGKRGVAEWPKLPRLSSTLLRWRGNERFTIRLAIGAVQDGNGSIGEVRLKHPTFIASGRH